MAEEHSHFTRSRTPSVRFDNNNSKRARSLDTKKLGFQGRSFTLSRESSEEVLNTDWNEDARMFSKVCDSFEKTLEEFDFTENSHEVREKLMRIQDLIDLKISSSKMSKKKSLDSLFKSPNSSISDLSRSMQSLCSESSFNLELNNNLDLKKYMKIVNCPFCSEIQSDEICFVKHFDRSCSSHLKKEFKKRDHLPYTTFQILPNNTFKCNICVNASLRKIQNFYLHMQSQAHLLDYEEVSKKRHYENLLFCSVCKVTVYNNYRQIKSHIESKTHLGRCSKKKTPEYFLQRGIHCIFNESNKFKCLDCPPCVAVCSTLQSVFEHFNSPSHKKNKKKNVFYSSIIYCEVCLKEVHWIEISSHFNSSQHFANQKKLKESGTEVCFFCDFCCNDLMELSRHMESNCAKITAVRQKISNETENITKGPCLTGKDCTKTSELITDGVLANKVKLDGSGKSSKSNETENESEASDSSSESENDTITLQDDHLDKLFARVSDHLMKTTQKLNSIEEIKIQGDCIDTLRLENCHFVGFSGSGLLFPSESINLFCGFKKDTSTPTALENLLKASHIILGDSKLFNNVEYCNSKEPYPCLKCIHKETHRSCTIIVDESSLVLTKMLRECMEKSELVKPFCLIIRFWLSVHELKIRNFEYALISLLVFFLVSANVVTLSEEAYGDCVLAWLFQGKMEVVQERIVNAKPIANVKELFQKFLRFVDSFDFDKHAIFLPLRDPVPRSLFSQSVLRDLPQVKNLKDCSMCIFDPTMSVNLAAHIEWQDRKAFLKVVAAAVKHYNIK